MRSLTIQNCPFIHNVEKMSGPKRSIKIADHFTCTSANVICSISCTCRKKLLPRQEDDKVINSVNTATWKK